MVRTAGTHSFPHTENMTLEAQSVDLAVRRGIRSSLLGIVVNLTLAIAKCLAGIMGHSFALIADGIESLSDVVSSSVVALGLWFAIKPPDQDHPYGHGKAEPIAAIVVSLALLAAGLSIAVESVKEIRTPHRLPAPLHLGRSTRRCPGQVAAVPVRRIGRGGD
jgi:divalent metal cation (Fe/Co/Zn/Cd) transporter